MTPAVAVAAAAAGERTSGVTLSRRTEPIVSARFPIHFLIKPYSSANVFIPEHRLVDSEIRPFI